MTTAIVINGEDWMLERRTSREDFGGATGRMMLSAGIVARLTVRRAGGRLLYHVNEYARGALGAPRRAEYGG
ncbi:MAG: hypothetical protein A2V88_08740 [Elusimicrobia bacterium RBG_16_66_12]|nr:MAG: hypothetical protein A2V88_08740 [Elusimicrobia bacterium RBG_16_66_12]